MRKKWHDGTIAACKQDTTDSKALFSLWKSVVGALEHAKQEHAAALEKLELTEGQRKAAAEARNALAAKLAECVAKAEHEKNALQNRITMLLRSMQHQHKTRTTSLYGKMDAILDTLADLEHARIVHNAEKTELERRIAQQDEQWSRDVDFLRDSVRVLKDRLKTANCENHELCQRLREAEMRCSKAQSELERSDAEVSSHRKSLTVLECALADIESHRDEFRAAVAKAEKQVESLLKSHERLSAVHEDNKRLTESKKALEVRLAAAQTQIVEISSTIIEKHHAMHDAKEELLRLQAETERYQKESEEKEGQLCSLREQQKATLAELRNKNKRLHEARDLVEACEKRHSSVLDAERQQQQAALSTELLKQREADCNSHSEEVKRLKESQRSFLVDLGARNASYLKGIQRKHEAELKQMVCRHEMELERFSRERKLDSERARLEVDESVARARHEERARLDAMVAQVEASWKERVRQMEAGAERSAQEIELVQGTVEKLREVLVLVDACMSSGLRRMSARVGGAVPEGVVGLYSSSVQLVKAPVHAGERQDEDKTAAAGAVERDTSGGMPGEGECRTWAELEERVISALTHLSKGIRQREEEKVDMSEKLCVSLSSFDRLLHNVESEVERARRRAQDWERGRETERESEHGKEVGAGEQGESRCNCVMTCILCRERWREKRARQAQAELERAAAHAQQQAAMRQAASCLLQLAEESAADAHAASEDVLACQGRWMIASALQELNHSRSPKPEAPACLSPRRPTVSEVIRRRDHLTLAAAFGDFTGAASAIRHERSVVAARVARAVPRYRAPVLHRHWQVWLAYVALSCEGKVEDEQQDALKHMWASLQYRAKEMLVRETTRRAEMSAKAVKRILKQHLAQAWAAWVDSIYTCRATRQTVCWMGERMAHHRLARAFGCFAGAVGALHAQRLQRARGKQKPPTHYEGTLI